MKRLPGQVKKGEFKSYGSSLVPKCFVKYSQMFVAGVQANTHTQEKKKKKIEDEFA